MLHSHGFSRETYQQQFILHLMNYYFRIRNMKKVTSSNAVNQLKNKTTYETQVGLSSVLNPQFSLSYSQSNQRLHSESELKFSSQNYKNTFAAIYSCSFRG